MKGTDLPQNKWKKSTRSNGTGGSNCVEVAELESGVAVRDSKDFTGPALMFRAGAWETFLEDVKSGKLDSGEQK